MGRYHMRSHKEERLAYIVVLMADLLKTTKEGVAVSAARSFAEKSYLFSTITFQAEKQLRFRVTRLPPRQKTCTKAHN
jgi:hypothetical protein